ncbi:hypothetical protein EI165_08435 [Pseudoalteromonas nigrifaciens]|uniref:hypothetical protein n=1 Tax=Pseudoalteromonas nigrifaciens TaxID=28109 RepID=UPI001787C3DC|nr:hypothetical protein [Pseudoalteromonas nigrifaciens]MBE0420150.1 hypothetical protein [Pseudoalteromonas nigrifaciens]
MNEDDLDLFEPHYHADVLGGINRAQEGSNRAFGLLANKLHQSFHLVEPYLQSSYTKQDGTKLGSSGRRELISAFLRDDNSKFKRLIA